MPVYPGAGIPILDSRAAVGTLTGFLFSSPEQRS